MKEKKKRQASKKFFFDCDIAHGRYQVTQKTMMQFLSKTDHFDEAKKRLESGAGGLVLKFHNGCPRCSSVNESAKVSVAIIKPPH